MIDKALFFLNKYRFPALILLIVLSGAFLRSYNFSDWMHFELDQSRDANLISNALDRGAGDLPLLGPKARGTLLRLGPIAYYFMYLGARIFGNTPSAMALPVLFFSILSLPVFYLLMRRYFDRLISTGLLAVFSCSIFLVIYSRFAWNPNFLPFFLLLFFYALLRAIDAEEKNKGWWLVASLASASIVTQLHFLAFVLIPTFLSGVLIFKRPRIAWKFWAGAFALAFLFYVPVVINEMKSGGKNTQQLIETMVDRSDGGNTGFAKKTAISGIESARYYFLIVTGKDDSDFLNINPAEKTNQYCDEGCLFTHPAGLLSALFMFSGLGLIFLRMRREHGPGRRDFLQLGVFWFALTSLIFVPLATDLSPRFFLLALPLPFIFLGLVLEKMASFNFQAKRILAILVFGALVFTNLHEAYQRFAELERAPKEASRVDVDKILKEKMRVTFAQEKEIVRYMLEAEEQNNFPIFYMSTAEYRPAFEYLLKRSGVLYDEISKNKVYREGNYFLILPPHAIEMGDASSYQDRYAVAERKDFGTLAVLRLRPIESAITADTKDFTPVPKKESRSKAPRYKWNQIFNPEDANEDDED